VKDVSGSSDDRDFYYNEDWQLLEARAGSSANPVEQFVWHPYYIDALAVRYYDADTDGSQVQHFCLKDANFNVTSVLDSGGAVLERYNYTPYGEVTFLNPDFSVKATQTSDIGNTLLFTGRERDPETGLQLNRRRYYASHLGRWLSRDPIAYVGNQLNVYEYGAGEPIQRVDPDGRLVQRIVVKCVTKVIGGIVRIICRRVLVPEECQEQKYCCYYECFPTVRGIPSWKQHSTRSDCDPPPEGPSFYCVLDHLVVGPCPSPN
jgi:RHS repeat-associated protein